MFNPPVEPPGKAEAVDVLSIRNPVLPFCLANLAASEVELSEAGAIATAGAGGAGGGAGGAAAGAEEDPIHIVMSPEYLSFVE